MTLQFTVVECNLSNSFSIRPEHLFDFWRHDNSGEAQTEHGDSYPPKPTEHQCINMRLRPGVASEDYRERWTRFSMFGTDRTIKDFQLEILPISNAEEQERCKAWGSVSNTVEVDFREVTDEDILGFNLFVKPERFAQYAELIRSGNIDEIIFRVGRVSGFYSGWSPSSSTNSVKVLTAADDEQAIDNAAGLEIEPPRLGDVDQCELHINRQVVFRKGELESTASDQDRSSPVEQMPAPPVVGADPEIRQMLKSLKMAAWWIVGLLMFIAYTASRR